MKEDEILDAPDELNTPIDKWKHAIIALLIILLGDTISIFILPLPFVIYIGVLASLFYFIKKVKPENLNVKQLFLWSFFIVYGSYLIVLFLVSHFALINHTHFDIYSIVEGFFFSVIIGYFPAIGVLHFLKSKNWAMLILMMAVSLMLISIFNFEY